MNLIEIHLKHTYKSIIYFSKFKKCLKSHVTSYTRKCQCKYMCNYKLSNCSLCWRNLGSRYLRCIICKRGFHSECLASYNYIQCNHEWTCIKCRENAHLSPKLIINC